MRIALLLSGGVDSSVALLRLKELGIGEVTAFYLKIWLEDELSHLGACPWEDDVSHAREACARAGVPLRLVPLQREYFERVVSYVVEELRRGNTPSPDVLCNRRVKFGAFLDAAGGSFDRIATGHYAIVEETESGPVLKRGIDRVKDQTYFLSHLRQDQVARAIFPIGGLQKTEVRRLAREWNLPNRDRRESQGICFLGKVKYPEFVRHYLGERPGPIVERDTGRVLGTHRGVWFHTVGQRQGLGLGGGPWYVVGKDLEESVVYVTSALRLPCWSRRSFEISRLHWIGSPPAGTRLEAKVRHGPEVRPCEIEWAEEDRLEVHLDTPDPGIAPGQFTVLYDGEICLGGGVIAPRGEAPGRTASATAFP